MAKKLRVGDRIRGYTITKVFGPGAMAISYAALAPGGGKVFFKQYKSPAPTVVWYGPFVDYQQELARRVRASKAAHYAVRLIDAFEEVWGGPCYFQAYEFVENGADLQHMLEEERQTHESTGVAPTSDPAHWARRVTWAKVFLAAMAALHEVKVVHADLKPPNVYLVRDPSIGAGFQLKLIDMDFSVLADVRAPWHGFQGYVGSDNYRSPEHMTKGASPTLASDVFTSALILYELLGGAHPYWREEQSEYAQLVFAHAARPPLLLGPLPPPADNRRLAAELHRALSPEAAKRPTIAELRAALAGREAGAAARAGSAPGTVAPPERAKAAAPAAAARGTALLSDRLRLVGANGHRLEVGVRTELGKHLAAQFGPDAAVWDARQVVLERAGDGRWLAVPVAGSVNETLLNGEVLTEPRPLSEGDVLAVGRKAKGIVKLPLTVHAG